MYLNVYEVTQAYGGREEGGWWYDVGVPLASVPVPHPEYDTESDKWTVDPREMPIEDARACADAENAFRDRFIDPEDRAQRRGRTSCAGGYDVWISYEPGFAAAFPDHRPHYE